MGTELRKIDPRIILPALLTVISLCLCQTKASYAQTWIRTYGGTESDNLSTLHPTPDGGFIAVGHSTSFSDNQQMWIVKLDVSGNVEWQRRYDTTSIITPASIALTPDEGYVVAGQVRDPDLNTSCSFVSKLDASGNIQWHKHYESSQTNTARSVIASNDGGFLVAGKKVNGGDEKTDAWVMSLDSSGSILWQGTYGGSLNDELSTLCLTSDNGIAVAGSTESFDLIFERPWFLKLDSSGNVLWQRYYVEESTSYTRSILETPDGGFALLGNMYSLPGTNVVIILLKLDSAGHKEWQRSYASPLREYGSAFTRTSDGGFIITGMTRDDDFLVIKADATGAPEWQRACGGEEIESAKSIHEVSTGSYIIAGYTSSFGSGGMDAMVLKVDGAGMLHPSCGLVKNYAMQAGIPELTVGESTVTMASSDVTATDIPLFGFDTAASVTDLCPDEDPCVEDIFEEDDSCPNAAPLILWEPQNHVFCEDPVDWLEFSAIGGLPYTIQTFNLDLLTDTVLELYESDGATLITSDDNSGEGFSSRLDWTPSRDALYTIRVIQENNLFGNHTGYTINLEGGRRPPSYWSRTFGDETSERTRAVSPTSDGGFIAAGGRGSHGTFDDETWISKLDGMGRVEWQEIFDGSGFDQVNDITQTSDGGYITAGHTDSFGAGGHDVWVMKLDSLGGIEWQKAYGGALEDQALSVLETGDRGFIVAGHTSSFIAPDSDVWLLKLDALGEVEWEKTYGSWENDKAFDIDTASDDGFVVAGSMPSGPPDNWPDCWFFKVDSRGNMVWEKTYGGALDDTAYSIKETSDGGFVMGGSTLSGEGYTFLLLKIDSDGNGEWAKTYGLPSLDLWPRTFEAQPTKDGGYLLLRNVQYSIPGKSTILLYKVDGNGEFDWRKTYDGEMGWEEAYDLCQAPDGGLLLAGETNSFTGELSSDAWILKLDGNGDIYDSCTFISAYDADCRSLPWPIINSESEVNPSEAIVTETAFIPKSADLPVSEQCAGDGPLPPLEVSPPGGVEPLLFTDKENLVWEDATLNRAETFNLYRGCTGDLIAGNDGECVQTDIPANTTRDSTQPSGGNCWFYLVTAVNNVGEGPMGHDSWEFTRVNAFPCP